MRTGATSVFGNELMTGFLNAGRNPLSRLTIAALQDMGYEVRLRERRPVRPAFGAVCATSR